jgi:uncharacterized protein YhfF
MEPYPPLEIVLSKLKAHGVKLPQGSVQLDAYGDSPELSEELLALIKTGQKRAGTCLLWSIEANGEPLPQVGDIDIVLDYQNEPVLLTRTTSVEVVPFSLVTPEYAAIEGEGDGSLDYWRNAHWSFFSRECKRLGRSPSETMPVVCSVFELLQILSPSFDSPP